MSNSQQNSCGACKGVDAATPVSVQNVPGLSALAYRVGTHSSFRESMIAALGKQEALRVLTTRADDDPTMALIDGWSTVLDVLGFYQERIANEAFLRTAAERRSVLELARSIGYELRPGVAASTYLSFTLEETPGAPEEVRIDVGTKVQSKPGQDELPQTFETVEQIPGRGAWNSLSPRTLAEHPIGMGTTMLYLSGTVTGLQQGDPLLVVGAERRDNAGNENWDVRKVKELVVDRDRQITVVELDRGLGSEVPHVKPAADDIRVYALRTRASLFGYNAPDWNAMPDEIRERYVAWYNNTYNPEPDLVKDSTPEWPGLTLSEIAGTDSGDSVLLDALYSKIVPNSWMVLSRPGYSELYLVEGASEDSLSRFTLSGKATRVQLSGEGLVETFDEYVRGTVVFAESEELEFAQKPIETPVPDPDDPDAIVLDVLADGLFEGQLFAIRGTGTDGEEKSEILELKKAERAGDRTRLVFTTDLVNEYVRDTVTINGNVARATHGESKTEVLGSGDGSQTFQKFLLKNTPLTYVSAPTASGVESTLEVRVNDVLWEEAGTFYGLGGKDRSYVLRLDDDGATRVLFGDGDTGARLPSGSENVTASYRTGIGMDGMVEQDQLSLLITRSLGLKKVTNPVAPSGAADPEELEEARENAPLTVLTLDRIVSLRDFEDFARGFAGVEKAQAAALWNGERRIVHLTLAGSDGEEIPAESDTYKNLIAAIDAARHPDQRVLAQSCEGFTFDLGARIKVDDRYIAENVLADVEDLLVEMFAFANRSFAQTLSSSEVIAAMQKVEGVVAVDLDALYVSAPFPSLQSRIVVLPARREGAALYPAQLLTINPDGISLTEMTQ